jgi:hypothetical protein
MEAMSKLELAETLGQLEKLGLIEPLKCPGNITRYQLTSVPVDEEENVPTRRIPARRVTGVEAASALQIIG